MYFSKKEELVDIINEEDEEDEFEMYPPSVCPYCGLAVKFIARGGFKSQETLITFECPHCNKLISALYNDTDYKPLNIYPPQPTQLAKIPEEILDISPEFKKIYIQASTAESNNLKELAALAYRRALEFLVKDFCIHKYPTSKDAIIKEHLSASIKRLEDISPIMNDIANKIRLIGNDYTHYQSKLNYTPSDMKKYINILIPFIQGSILSEQPL